MSETLFVESPRHQRPAEAIAYTVDTTPYGGGPTNVAVVLYQVAADGAQTNVSGTKLSGSPGVSGDVITTPLVTALVANSVYLLEVRFTCGGSTWAPACYLFGKP